MSRAALVELVGGSEFVQLALGGLDRQPMQEAHHGGAIARLGGAMAFLLGRVLAGLGQHGGIAFLDDGCAGRLQFVENRLDRSLRIDRDFLALERRQRRHKSLARHDPHGVAEMRLQFGSDLFFGNEEVGGAVGMGNDKGQDHWCALDIAASDVEQPGDRIECGNDGRVALLGRQPFRNRGALGFARLAGEAVVVDERRGRRWCGLLGPDGVDRIAIGRDQNGIAILQRFFGGGHPGLRVQPGIVTDPRAFGGMFAQPLGDRRLRHAFIGIVGGVHLVAHLQSVAPVDKDRGAVLQHYRCSRRAVEAGEPLQALGIGADIFAHVLVGDGHDEAVENSGAPVPRGAQ